MTRRQPGVLGTRWNDWFLKPCHETILIASRDQRRSRRRAYGRIRIALSETDPLDREAVNVRRRVVTLAVAAQVGVAEVVGHDEDDIRPAGLPAGLRPTGAAETQAREGQRTDGGRLDKSTTGDRALVMCHLSSSCESATFGEAEFPKSEMKRLIERHRPGSLDEITDHRNLPRLLPLGSEPHGEGRNAPTEKCLS